MQEKVRDLDKLLEEAIDESLNVLGKSGKQMLFFNLEKSCSVKKHEIVQKPEVFEAVIHQIFGAGASVLEKIIVKSVYSKLGLKFQEKKNYTFSDYLKDIILSSETDESLQVTC